MNCTQCLLAMMAVLSIKGVAAAVLQPRAEAARGDSYNVDTKYDLTTYSKPGFRGEAVRLNADQCVRFDEHQVDVASVKFSGNNACLFFPTADCSNPIGGQRIVGNVRDVGAWGFPTGRPAAVKCLSHSASEILKHNVCDLDASCAAQAASGTGAQGKCPFEASCTAYDPVYTSDWLDVAPAMRHLAVNVTVDASVDASLPLNGTFPLVRRDVDVDVDDDDNLGGVIMDQEADDSMDWDTMDEEEVPEGMEPGEVASAAQKPPKPVGGPVLERFEVGGDGKRIDPPTAAAPTGRSGGGRRGPGAIFRGIRSGNRDARAGRRPANPDNLGKPATGSSTDSTSLKMPGIYGPKGYGDENAVDDNGEPIVNHRPVAPSRSHDRKNNRSMRKYEKTKQREERKKEAAARSQYTSDKAAEGWQAAHPDPRV